MDIVLIVTLALMGALLGSFAVAQVWRLRAAQLVQDEKDGEPVNKAELRNLRRLLRPAHTDRSECLSCHHQLAWYDLVPIVSWLSLGGKCRYCRAPIGYTEVVAEVGLAAVFALSYIAWPYPLVTPGQVAAFVVWLVACVAMTILFVYDAKWSLLPFGLNMLLIALGVAYAVLQYAVGGVPFDLVSLAGAITLLGGIYLLFSVFGWVGMGDGILGIGLALFVGSWQLAFLALFVANLLGCLMIIPLYLNKKLHRKLKIPFGPFLIAGAVIAVLAGNWLIATLFTITNSVLFTLMV